MHIRPVVVFIIFYGVWCLHICRGEDMGRIGRKIQIARETEIIKNKILQELKWGNATPENSYPQRPKSNVLRPPPLPIGGHVPVQVPYVPLAPVTPPVHEERVQEEEPEEPLLIFGKESSNSRKNKCLDFNFWTARNRVPHKMPLYLYIRKSRGRKKKRRQEEDAAPRLKRQTENEVRRKRKNKKRNKSKRIKIFITDGNRTVNLVTTKLKIKKSQWHGFDLPISHFPEVFRNNETYTLCFKCKKCNRRVKLELFQKQKKRNASSKAKVFLPFISVESRPQLPQSLYRHKRSSRLLTSPPTSISQTFPLGARKFLPSPCCSPVTVEENLTSTFPSILYPEMLNITVCVSSPLTESHPHYVMKNNQIHSDVTNDDISNDVTKPSSTNLYVHCEPHTYTDFSFVYMDKYFNVKYGTIGKLLPSKCRCRITSL